MVSMHDKCAIHAAGLCPFMRRSQVSSTVHDRMTNDRDNDTEIKARQNAAGRFGFTLGCIAAVLAFAINVYRAPRPLSAMTLVLAALMAALNIPLGIAFGLAGERISRRRGRPQR